MFNTTEHILHLYECIDELRDDIHELRYRTPPLPPFIEPYPPGILTDNIRPTGRTGSNRTNSGLNWSVELENERSTRRRIGTGTGSRSRSRSRNKNKGWGRSQLYGLNLGRSCCSGCKLIWNFHC